MHYTLPLFCSKSVGSYKLPQNHAYFLTPKLLESQALGSHKLTRQKSKPFLPLGFFLQEPNNFCEQDTGQCFDSSRAKTKAFPLPYCSEPMLSCKDFTERLHLCGSFGSYMGGKLAGEEQSQEHLFKVICTWMT